MYVRPATPADAEAVHAVHVAAVQDLAGEVYRDAVVDSWTSVLSPDGYEFDGDDPFLVAVGDSAARDGDDSTARDGDDSAAHHGAADGDVVGFGSATLPDDDVPTGRVTGVYVDPATTRQGAGAALESALAECAREAGCEALSLGASINAVPFYHERGYEPVEATSHEFGGDEPGPALEMRREL